MNKKEDILIDNNLRADSYKFLSSCYYLPDEELVDVISKRDDSEPDPHRDIIKAFPGKEGIGSLRTDYARLFVGPFKLIAPPYGSIYLENARQVMGDSTIAASNLYKQEGLEVSLKEAPDHIAIELEFMYFLVLNEAAAVKESDQKKAEGYIEKQRSFLGDYLGKWVFEFTEIVEKGASTEFYKTLAHSTKLFIKDDMDYLF